MRQALITIDTAYLTFNTVPQPQAEILGVLHEQEIGETLKGIVDFACKFCAGHGFRLCPIQGALLIAAKHPLGKNVFSTLCSRNWIASTLIVLSMAIGANAQAARPIEIFKENESLAGMGIIFAHSRDLGFDAVLYSTSIDAKLAYSELSEKDRRIWKAQYDAMPDEDEPPFPINGLISMLRPIAALASVTEEAGAVIVHLEIDSEGKPRKADLLASPTPEFGPRAIASLMSATYKPAKCRDMPCTMSIPVRIMLVRGGNI